MSSAVTSSSTSSYLSVEEDDINSDTHTPTLIGSGEYQIVGIRYYKGVAHPGEYIELIREPNNPYDRNAIRVDNLRGEKIGHVKATMAKLLAPIMDRRHGLGLSFYGLIPRKGNPFTLPLFLEIYFTGRQDQEQDQEQTQQAVEVVQKALKRDYSFQLSRELGGEGVSASSMSVVANGDEAPKSKVTRKKLDWNQQQKALDDMFDKTLSEQYKDLPNISMPSCLKGVTLFDHQVQGIKWLFKREMDGRAAPFYKKIKENGRDMYLCEITNSSQIEPPKPIRGALLCDDMGLGKTLVTIGLILLAPPPGVEYKEKQHECAENDADETSKEFIPMPEENVIRAANVSTLKSVLKAAKLKVSGKKVDLVQRVLDGKGTQDITGEHFPITMRPKLGIVASATSTRCTLIVCPVSVMSNWTHQVQSHVEDGVLSLQMYHGANRQDLLPAIRAGNVDILLVSYHTLAAEYGSSFGEYSTCTRSGEEEQKKKKAKRETIFDIDFHRIVLDEAHTIRSSKTSFFKAVKVIKAERKLALTGTPFVNRADDVHSLLSFLGVEPLNNKYIFTRAISQCIKNGDEIGLTRLRACMGFVSLRRSKQSVDIKLVEKDVQLCIVDFPDDMHKKVYDALFGTLKVAMEAILSEGDGNQALKNYSSIFEKILRLRQACCSGTLVAKERREIAMKVWNEINAVSETKKLSPREGLELLEKLKGAFSEEPDSLPECGICLIEMEESDGTILKSCSHVFCKICIQQVLSKSNRKCPYCRVDFDENDIIDMSTAKSAANTDSALHGKEHSTSTFGTPPKIQALLDAMRRMKSDEKGVIFSQFTKYLDLIEDALKYAGHTFVRIDGSVPAQKRISYISKFNSDEPDAPRFILCSLLASGTGINLTRGNYAFMMDCWWNEAIESQAMDRIHRINQTRNVTVLRFVMKDSIEERIVALQEAKSMQARGVLQKLKSDEKKKALLGDLRGLLQIEE